MKFFLTYVMVIYRWISANENKVKEKNNLSVLTIREKYYIINMYGNLKGRSGLLNILVSASVLSADMLNLEREIRRLESSGTDMLHFDVMDGLFVNNITFGLPILEQIRRKTDMTLDVHLMIDNPLRYIERFADAGADIITFHAEAGSNIRETIDAIKAAGKKPSVSIKPGTPAEVILPYLKDLYMVLVMTVEPGFGGQSFIPETLEKISEIRKEADRLGLDLHIEVDGGINPDTAGAVKAAGADVLVSGSYLFNADDMCDTVTIIKEVN